MTTFTDLVVTEAENDPGLVVTRALTADGAGINLSRYRLARPELEHNGDGRGDE